MPERGWKTSTVPVVWGTFGNFSVMRYPNDFLSRLLTMDETWLYHYAPREGKNQWSGGIVARPPPSNTPPKFRSAKIRWKSSRLFLGIKSASSSLITFHSAKLSTRSITHVCWCNWRTFWRKNAVLREGDQMGLFLYYNAPAHRALATQKKLAYLGFHSLVHPPYSPDLVPLDYRLFPGLK